MKLVRLTIGKLPGIADGLELAPATDRVSVVVGPNASGKTSLIRALAVLLQRRPEARPVDIRAEFSDGEHRITGTAIGQARTWLLDGDRTERPAWPGAEGLAAYLIRADELADAGATERQFSDTLRQIMAGGYNLDALARSAGFERPGRPQKLSRDYDRAVRDLQSLETRYAGLAGEIDQLESMRDEQRESIEAQRRLQAQKRALELLELEQKRAAVHQALERFSEGMDALDGAEGERLERLDAEIEQRRLRLNRTRRTRSEAEQHLEQSGIRDIQAMEAFAADIGERRQQLQTLEHKLGELRQAGRDCERMHRTAARRAGQTGAEPARCLTDDALDGLEKLAERVGGTQRQVDALRRETGWRTRLSPDPLDSADPDGELADLESAIESLRAWLASAPATVTGWVVWSLLLAGTAGSAAWAWFELDRPTIAAIAAAAALMPISHLAVLAARAWRATRHRERFEATDLARPDRWRRPGLEQRLRQLESRLARTLQEKREAERTAEVAAELQRARAQLQSEQRQLEMAADRLEVRTEWLLEARGQLRLRALLDLRETEDRLAQTRGAIDDLDSRRRALIEKISAEFEQASQPAPAEISADSLGSFLNRINPKIMQARSALDAIANADTRLTELEDEADTLAADRRALFETVGLAADNLDDGGDASDDDGHDDSDAGARERLRERLRRLPEWRSLNDELRGLEHARRVSLEALGEHADLLEMVRRRDDAGLVQLGQSLSAAAERRDRLAERIATIESEQKAALEQRELERLNAERERLRRALHDSLEARRDAEAAQLLIERARAGYSAEHQPALFTRARALFGRMTRTRFELTFDGDSFGAHDQAMAENRSIGELSTATRIQLLLALRMAWIEETERKGPDLPIFLDEVLATTDPERYRAVVEAVQELVRGGRQVIYLSSQPADAQAWQRFAGDPAPEIIELAPVADAAFGFELPAPLVCPDPELNADEWAIAADVAPLDPWRGTEALDLFHLLRDRLHALNALRGYGITTLGQFEHARELALELPLDTKLARMLDGRIRAARAWLERWRRGHVPPVADRDLVESDAISETFIEQVIELNRESGGNGNALIDALRNGAVSGFFKKKTDELEQELAAAGLLDQPQAPTNPELIDTLARAGELESDHAARLHRWLQAALVR